MKVPVDQERTELIEDLIRSVIEALPRFVRRPVATYRVQLQPGFGFRQLAELVPYLASLGVSDLYASPYLKAAAGSTHGYDVVDHQELNPELGTPEEFEALVRALAAQGMSHILDFVPNHMAIGSANPLWMDVLENGPSSVFAHVFDIDWKPIKEELENRVLVPILGDQYGAVLERGELQLSFEGGAFALHYWEHRFPVAPRQYTQILRHRLEDLQRQLPAGDVHYEDYLSIVGALANLPPRTEADPERIAERHREKEVIKRRITALCEACPQVKAFIEENVRIFNGTPGEPRSFDPLDKLLREQAYRLAYWRVAAEEINYRRFFDINNLAAIRMEDPRVFALAHSLVFRLIAEGKLAGLRIDHPDGLFAPTDYFAALQEELAVTLARGIFRDGFAPREGLGGEALELAWGEVEPALRERLRAERARGTASPLFRPLYVVAEKILARDEPMPGGWAIHGTTGYDFLNAVNGLFVDGRNARAIEDLSARFTGQRLDYGELVYQKRRETMGDSMASEINVLARQLSRISEHDRRTRDFTLNSLRRALIEVLACFPVYRTYRSERGEPADERDRRYVEAAVDRAKRRNPAVSATIFDFLREVLLGRADAQVPEVDREARLQFALKLQQVTAPVMAKSVEDTVFYQYNRLVSLNEVGGDPATVGMPVEAFHAANRLRAERWPATLTATSTHDTKRGEDVRARIDVLSEIPSEWRRRLVLWSRLNRGLRTAVGERVAPDRNEELLLYQTLLGTWPFGPLEGRDLEVYRARIQDYMLKALKEAKLHTSWVNPDEAWERAVTDFVAGVLDPKRSARFWKDFAALHVRVARAGAFNALSQVLLKVASPGVPDVYQGCELWDLSLVDPDNRRPIDFASRRELLFALDERLAAEGRKRVAQEVLERLEDGRIKLYVTSQALRLRQRWPELFREGDYVALFPEGDRARHLVGFARRLHERSALVLAPRFTYGLLERGADLVGERVWGDAFVPVPLEVARGRLVDAFTGAVVPLVEAHGRSGIRVAEALAEFPLALLVPEGEGGEGPPERAEASLEAAAPA